MATETNSNKRLAKNTIALYMRTIVLMLVALYTSRVILDVLKVEDYGVYEVVGGAIAMFGVVSGSIANAISRFITFELGKGDQDILRQVFITSVNIQIGIGLFVLLLGETIGLWFLNSYMSIPDGRLYAANWVLHCSLFAFVINLLSIPYNACIIAHEKMTAYAYIGIIDAVLRLAIVLVLPFFSFDKLILYSFLVFAEALIVRLIYAIYCNRNFIECRYCLSFNYPLMKEMAGFSGWQFLTNTCWIVNDQGLNIISNIFFGVRVNAARGIASQVGGAVTQFVGNFMTALNPQIVKSYAQNDTNRFFRLICQGAKFSFYMLLLLALPIMIETDYILGIWLKQIPDYSVLFVRLSIIASIMNTLGNTGVTACMATGDIKRYTIILSAVGYTVFPVTLLAFWLGLNAEFAYIIFIVVYFLIIFVRLYVMKGLLNFPPSLFIREVLVPIVPVSITAVVAPLYIKTVINESFLRFFVVFVISIITTSASFYFFCLSRDEKTALKNYIINKIKSR